MAVAARDAMSSKVEHALRTIFKRCVQCPDSMPTCPDCPNGQICSLVPQDCDACQHMTCIANPNPAPASSGPNVGAIAGGVIGGIVFIAVVVFFLWRFWIRKRRAQQDLEEWDDDIARQKSTHRGSAMQSDAASIRTRASLATSILSRASNIIQIAYIPGVTNRNGSSHNSLAPVPPIPAQYANSSGPRSPLSNEGDMLFFRPGDLRDSTWSGTSSRSGNRDTQYTHATRQSITPSLARSSVVSDVYRDDATMEPMPATTVMRAAPRMVSVKSSPLSTPMETPESGSSSSKLVKVMIPGQGEASSSSPSFNSGGSGFAGKPTQIKIGRGKGRFPVRSTSDETIPHSGRRTPTVSSPLIETTIESEDDELDEHARARQSLIKPSNDASNPSSPLARQPMQSPFFDASELQTPASSSAMNRPNPYAAMSSSVGSNPHSSPKRGPRMGAGLSAVIEEATKRASRNNSHEASPFSDDHIIE